MKSAQSSPVLKREIDDSSTTPEAPGCHPRLTSPVSSPVIKRESEQDFMSRILSDVTPLDQLSLNPSTNWKEKATNLMVDMIHDPHGLRKEVLQGTQHELTSALAELKELPVRRVSAVTLKVREEVEGWMERMMMEAPWGRHLGARRRRRSKDQEDEDREDGESTDDDSDDVSDFSLGDEDEEGRRGIEQDDDVTDYCEDGLQAGLVARAGWQRRRDRKEVSAGFRPPQDHSDTPFQWPSATFEGVVSKFRAFPSAHTLSWHPPRSMKDSATEVEEKFRKWWDHMFYVEEESTVGSLREESDPSVVSDTREPAQVTVSVGQDLEAESGGGDLRVGDVADDVAADVARATSGLEASSSGALQREVIEADTTRRTMRKSGSREKLKRVQRGASASGSSIGGDSLRGVRSWWREEMVSLGRIQHLVRQLLGKNLGSGLEGAAALDPLAAMIVWREQKRRSRAKKEGDRELNPHDLPEPLPPLQPARRALQHACAAYGTLGEMHLTRMREMSRQHWGRVVQRMWTDPALLVDSEQHPDTQAAARLAGCPAEDIILAHWSNMAFCPCCYLAVDHSAKWVVLAIRGTACAGDTLTDCCADSAPFLSGHAHAGILAATWQLLPPFFPRLAQTILKHPDYQVVTTGHSMGAGVATLLAMLLHSQDQDVRAALERGVATRHSNTDTRTFQSEEEAMNLVLSAVGKTVCYALAAPCVCTRDLSRECAGYVTTVVAGKDVICRLSVVNLQNLGDRLRSATPLQPVLRAVSQALRAANEAATSVMEDIQDQHDSDDDSDDDSDSVQQRSRSSSSSGVGSGQKEVSSSSRPEVEEHEEERDDGNVGGGSIGSNVRSDVSTGNTQVKRASGCECEEDEEEEEEEEPRAWTIDGDMGTELRNLNSPDFLCLPGKVIHLRHLNSKHPTAQVRDTSAFSEIPLSSRMMSDHMPITYVNTMDRILSQDRA